MNSLILFNGNDCVGKAARELGHNVVTSDIKQFGNSNDYVVDILDFDPSKIPFHPDFIWGSPPCEKFSICNAVPGGTMYWERIGKDEIRERLNFDYVNKKLTNPQKIKEELELHKRIVNKTVEIIKYYNPSVWIIENPATGYMRLYLKRFIEFYNNKVTYCQYGFDYRKETSLFSNIKLNLKHCKVGDPCHGDTFYQRYDGTPQEKIETKRNYIDRSAIPHDLCIDVLNQVSSYIDSLVLS